MTHKLTKRFVNALPWTIGDAVVSVIYGIGMIILLGRFVSPQDVGTGAIALAVSQIVEGLSCCGIQEAVIRARSGDTSVTDTAYVLALMTSMLGFGICVCLAWPLSILFANSQLLLLLIVAGLMLPTNALATVPTGILARKMRASSLTRRFIFGKICGLVTLTLTGLAHFGPWCMVLSGLAVSFGSLFSVALGCSRWPHIRLKLKDATELFHFGGVIALETFVWICTGKIFSILFGFFHGMADLGFFQFGLRMVEEIAALLQTSFSRLGFSYFSSLERGGLHMGSSIEVASRILITVSVAIYIGLALVADDIVPLLFGLKWIPMIPFIKILAVSSAVSFPFILTPAILKAKGRPDLLFWFSLYRAIFVLLACVATGMLSSIFGALCWAASAFLSIPWNLHQIKRFAEISILRQFYQMVPATIAAIIMFIVVQTIYSLDRDGTSIVRLVTSVTIGGSIYFLVICAIDSVIRALVQSAFMRLKCSTFSL